MAWEDVDALDKGALQDDEEYADLSIEVLRRAPDVNSEAVQSAWNYAEERNKAKVARLEADNAMRVKFFGWSSRLAAWMIGGNFAIFAAYIALRSADRDPAPDGVMLAWVSATVVEIIGVVAIIARHLFPGKRPRSVNANEK